MTAGETPTLDAEQLAQRGIAYQALLALPVEQRALVLCWFCDGCHEHVGPGARHSCKMGSHVWPPADGTSDVDDSVRDPSTANYLHRLSGRLTGPATRRPNGDDGELLADIAHRLGQLRSVAEKARAIAPADGSMDKLFAAIDRALEAAP